MSNETSELGPLAAYLGTWSGTGIDTVPDGKGGSTATPFIQEITFTAAPELGYGSQKVHAIRYNCFDWATDDNADPATMFPVFEERGYFIWVAEDNEIILQVSNPRGLSMMAIGTPESDGSFNVTTKVPDDSYGVLVSNYLKTVEIPVAYEASMNFLSDEQLHYTTNTILEMPDGSIFNQTDITTLQRY